MVLKEMYTKMYTIYFLIFFFIVVSSLKIWSYFNCLKTYIDSPFECGIKSNLSSRKVFSLSFFLITLIFLLFDIEIILLMPFVNISNFLSFIFLWLYIFLLFMGLLLEWILGSLKWNHMNFKIK